jgi:hypothetical protein
MIAAVNGESVRTPFPRGARYTAAFDWLLRSELSRIAPCARQVRSRLVTITGAWLPRVIRFA